MILCWAEINALTLSRFRFPPLYSSGVRYSEERDDGVETFRDVASIVKKGSTDCNNLVAWRAAEHILDGTPFDIGVEWAREGNRWVYHVFLTLQDGAKEDPSRLLGMK